MSKGANTSTVSEEHATYVDSLDNGSKFLRIVGNMVHTHTMLTPKTRENNKIHITIKVAQFRKTGNVHFQNKTKCTSVIAVGYDSKLSN